MSGGENGSVQTTLAEMMKNSVRDKLSHRIARHLLGPLLLCLCACASTPQAEAEPVNEPTGSRGASECQTDDDCRLSTLRRETCCSRCAETALTGAEYEDLNRYCAEHAGGGCPSLDCPYEPSRAACSAGQCVRVLD